MNAADPKRSGRLQRVLALLQDGEPHTTLDIVTGANVCAVSAVISELRAHGHDIACWRQGDRWFYRLDVRRKAA